MTTSARRTGGSEAAVPSAAAGYEQEPDEPKLRLDELLAELTDRARNVLALQDRLRALLRANAVVISDLSTPLVLRHLVEAARELAEARYCALGVLSAGGSSLDQFVYDGVDPQTVQLIGRLPRGLGVLGLLDGTDRAVRLSDVTTHPAAIGFPEHHPRMTSFLGVPIRLRGQHFGNLYLADSTKGEFSADDEQLVIALAATAAIAIENARLYDEAELRRQWQSASTELTEQLFAGRVEHPLELILRLAMREAAGDFAVLALLCGNDQLRVESAVGVRDDTIGRLLSSEQCVAVQVVHSGQAVLVGTADATRVEERYAYSSAVVAPLTAGERILGTLGIARREQRLAFSECDRDQVANFARHAGLALDLYRARARVTDA